ncbi:helix-turn-helix domain-containing protein [Streptomyces sp. 3214.6]|uniref:helix-turn-helix domain-containing protein n=1 Tax=Streptomyces sp. 3214.6 TaxID=1882757 RepID=UPI00090A16E3|nr:helix-turn-helix domain-containing protein [Streptomyces sp. 3214.6]SHI49859.1 AraC-type DNA-binding protein [Streptomyces sp. 3214.6]
MSTTSSATSNAISDVPSATGNDPSANGRFGPPSLCVEILTGEQSEWTGARLPGEGRPHPAHRLLAQDRGEYLLVGLRGGATAPDPRPLALHLAPGDICFYDARHAPALDFAAGCRATVFLVPSELLGLARHDTARVARTPVARDSPLGALLSPLLSDLARTAAEVGPPVGEMLAWNAVNLLATLVAEQSGTATGTGADVGAGGVPGTPGGRSPLLVRVMEYVELHLTDPDLSPEVIARAHHISVRYLHKLFKEEDTTVGRWILRRRLEECRRDLMRNGRGSRTIAAVAGRWGFLSAAHFSRVFRSAYGMSPREWRDMAGGGRM